MGFCCQRGFTLLELIIVTAVVGIFAVIAMPIYQDYMIKARVLEIIVAGDGCRAQVMTGYQTELFPNAASNNLWGCESVQGTPSSKYVSGVTVDADGVITITARTDESSLGLFMGAKINLYPMASGEVLATLAAPKSVQYFNCAGHSSNSLAQNQYLPAKCQFAGSGSGSGSGSCLLYTSDAADE